MLNVYCIVHVGSCPSVHFLPTYLYKRLDNELAIVRIFIKNREETFCVIYPSALDEYFIIHRLFHSSTEKANYINEPRAPGLNSRMYVLKHCQERAALL